MSDDESLLNDLISMIPGYGAYREQESRRQDDALTREFLASRLRQCKSSLTQLGQQAVAAGDLELPAQVERLRDRVDLAERRLEAAVEGYSGWFSKRKVDAKLLKDVATLDANLVSLVDRLDTLCAALSPTSNPQQSDWSELSEVIDRLHTRIDRRGEILKSGA